MNKQIMISDEAIRVADLVEQIQSTNEMLVLHQDDEVDFMYRQYQLRKSKLVEELKKMVLSLKIDLLLGNAA
jgi:ABC-type antimicrobial peptide transport system ATPase subunit